jgi:hypothetical protein
MGGDENQSEVLNAWCKNVDELRSRHNLAVVIVHHKGKSTTGAGRGSNVFDSWLDTMLWLEPTKATSWNNQEPGGLPDLTQVRLPIQGRDTDQRELAVAFHYPTWQLTDKQETAEQSKAVEATKCIQAAMKTQTEIPLADLRRQVSKQGHTDYAFRRALKRLVADGILEENQDSGKQGNHKIVRWVSPPE